MALRLKLSLPLWHQISYLFQSSSLIFNSLLGYKKLLIITVWNLFLFLFRDFLFRCFSEFIDNFRQIFLSYLINDLPMQFWQGSFNFIFTKGNPSILFHLSDYNPVNCALGSNQIWALSLGFAKLKLLKRLNFPYFIESQHLICQTSSSNKEPNCSSFMKINHPQPRFITGILFTSKW